MRRREFITLVGGAAVWPIAARAQQTSMPQIGFLGGSTETGFAAQLSAALDGLRETGFVDGQNAVIHYRWADNRPELLPQLATELVSRNPSVILTLGGTRTALAAKAATRSIPIVFALGGDPVRAGLVESLGRPGGNVTGVTAFSEAMITKRVELVHELLPGASLIGILLDPDNANFEARTTDVQGAGQQLHQDIRIFHAATKEQLEPVFAAAAREGVRAMVIQDDPLFNSAEKEFVALASRYKIPAAFQWRQFPEQGGLLSYGPILRQNYRQAGIYVARILKGEKPSELPVILPTKFELVINLKTARSLGLTIPPTLLARADEVIE
jgi:putative tryptophan/tyrosine transport system substrate-binding protein